MKPLVYRVALRFERHWLRDGNPVASLARALEETDATITKVKP